MQHFDREETGTGFCLVTRPSRETKKIMACVLNFVLLVLAFASSAGATVPYGTAYFEQNLDHFNFVQVKTFKQRYIYTGKSACYLLYSFSSSSAGAALSFFLFNNYFKFEHPPPPPP